MAGLLAGATGCQTHDRVIYATRTPKNLRIWHPGDTAILPADMSTPPSAVSRGTTPVMGSPSAPAAAQ
ncbi:MAG: hypothetical protein QOD99_1502 [Chthoniobacter sp.]|jgi:hypothetical protein|nr:hypothetical protein [Chthoniobacter sp.]